MNSTFNFRALLFLFVSFLISTAWAHGPTEERIVIEPEIMQSAAGKVQYRFQVFDVENGTMLDPSSLNVVHEKLLHLLIYDPSLNEFRHEHPEFDGTYWSTEIELSTDGNYWIWAQGEVAVDGYEFSANNRLLITGGKSALPTPPHLIETLKGNSGNSTVEISGGKVKAGKMVMLNVTLSRNDGTKAKITPYLGAFAHIVAVPTDGDALIHVHPMNTKNPNEGMLHATFPTKGVYRLWIQFMDDGNLRTIPLAIEVQ